MKPNPNKQPITLALELSQRTGSVAMSNGCGETKVCEVGTGRRDKDDVMPSLVEIAKEISVEPCEVELIVVSIGPGGFTGLRTAVSIAKMMSFSTGATIVPVETAEVIVSSSTQTDGLFIVVSGVKDDTFWLSKVYCYNNELKCESQLSSTDLFADQLDGVSGVFADTYFPNPVNELCNDYNVPIHQSCCDAVSLLKLGLKYHGEGINIDPKTLLPLYPREPEAVRLWKLKLHSS